MTNPIAQTAPPARTHSNATWILTLLFLGNVLNFYDRQLPGILLEQIKAEFLLDDAQVGLLASAFIVVGAIAGVPLGYLADRFARKWIAGLGLIVWSVFTGLGGVLQSFGGFFATRVGVGIGEAAYSPATGSLISDLYPSERRARANAFFNYGFPLGILLSFLTVGAIAEAFGSWRAPFLVAAVPGLIVGILVLLIKEPRRGAADADALAEAAAQADPGTAGAAAEQADKGAARRRALSAVLRVPSMYGLMLAFAGYSFAAYAIGTFLTPVLQRYYGLELVPAALLSGVVIGVAGFIGLIIGGRTLDRAARISAGRRVLVGAISLVLAAVMSVIGLAAAQGALWQLIVFASLGYLFGMVYLAASVPAITDVIRPHQRSTAIGLVYAIALLLGGAGGPVLTGALSDSLAAGSDLPADVAVAGGLQTAMMILVPIGYAVGAIGMFLAARFVTRDRVRMLETESAA